MLKTVKGFYNGTKVVVDTSDAHLLHTGDQLIITILEKEEETEESLQAKRERKLTYLEEFDKRPIRPTEIADHAVEYVRELRDNDRN